MINNKDERGVSDRITRLPRVSSEERKEPIELCRKGIYFIL